MPVYFFTLDEVAEILKLERRTIQRYIRNGSLAAYKLGTARNATTRISQEDLDAFLATQRVRA